MTAAAEPLPEGLADQLTATRPSGALRETVRNILAQRSAVVGLVILGAFVLMAIFADQISPYDPVRDQLTGAGQPGRRADPCWHFLGCPTTQPESIFGTDGNSRDLFSRVVHGTRISLQVGFVVVGIALAIGSLLGAIAGYVGGWVDNILMRLMDVLLAFPSLLLAITLAIYLPFLGESVPALAPFVSSRLYNAQLAIAIVAIPVYARVMRASVLAVREQDFVTASRALGESGRGILFRRVVPNALTPLIVAGTLGVAGAVLEVAALSFLGLGAPPEVAEWGGMISAHRNDIFSAPHLVLVPGVALTLTVLAFNLLGDGLRDALDPRLNR